MVTFDPNLIWNKRNKQRLFWFTLAPFVSNLGEVGKEKVEQFQYN